MKPFTFRCRKARRLLCSTEKARNRSSLTGRLATRMLSNVQLLPCETGMHPVAWTGGHIARGRLRVNRPAETKALGQRFPNGVTDLMSFAHEDRCPQPTEDEADTHIIAEEGKRLFRVHGQNQHAER